MNHPTADWGSYLREQIAQEDDARVPSSEPHSDLRQANEFIREYATDALGEALANDETLCIHLAQAYIHGDTAVFGAMMFKLFNEYRENL